MIFGFPVEGVNQVVYVKNVNSRACDTRGQIKCSLIKFLQKSYLRSPVIYRTGIASRIELQKTQNLRLESLELQS